LKSAWCGTLGFLERDEIKKQNRFVQSGCVTRFRFQYRFRVFRCERRACNNLLFHFSGSSPFHTLNSTAWVLDRLCFLFGYSHVRCLEIIWVNLSLKFFRGVLVRFFASTAGPLGETGYSSSFGNPPISEPI
jgi:hypothetical protein